MLIISVSCVPISSRWDPTKPSSCLDRLTFYSAALSTDVITDGKLCTSRSGVEQINLMTFLLGLILLLPIYKVQKLQMPLQQKLAVIGIFGLGALVTIMGIIRLHFTVRATAPLALSHDPRCTFIPISSDY